MSAKIEYLCVYLACKDNEFLCDGGRCIPLNKRCNFRRDCEDGTDELNCEVTIPTTGKFFFLYIYLQGFQKAGKPEKFRKVREFLATQKIQRIS